VRDISHLGRDGYLFVERILPNLHLDNLITESSSNFFESLLFGFSVSGSANWIRQTAILGHLRVEKVDDEKVHRTAGNKHIVVVLTDIFKGAGARLGYCRKPVSTTSMEQRAILPTRDVDRVMAECG
jgi:hypothetical protein